MLYYSTLNIYYDVFYDYQWNLIQIPDFKLDALMG